MSDLEPEVSTSISDCFAVLMALRGDNRDALEALVRGIEPGVPAAWILAAKSEDGAGLGKSVSRASKLRVHEVDDEITLAPRTLYLISEPARFEVRDGWLRSRPASDDATGSAVDDLLHGVAREFGDRGVGVIAVGEEADGRRGIRSIKRAGGLVIAQAPAAAEEPGAPVVARDWVDAVVDAAGVGELVGSYVRARGAATDEVVLDDDTLAAILARVASSSGHDYEGYRPSTLRRRIRHRMRVVGESTAAGYLAFLACENEAAILARELLVSVTGFFREEEALGRLLDEALAVPRPAGESDDFTVWVAGCSTGEEAYSTAILLDELARAGKLPVPARVIATDVNRSALERARAAVYPPEVSGDIAAGRLAEYFEREKAGFRVSAAIRERVTFLRSDLRVDAVPAAVDAVVCRNLLIYFDVETRAAALRSLVGALRPQGVLGLGANEDFGILPDDLVVVDEAARIAARGRERSEGAPGSARSPIPTVAKTVTPRLDRSLESGPLAQVITGLEDMNEVLQSSNAELLASNEALQATNAELQRANVNLLRTNSRYEEMIAELTEIGDDIENSLQSTGVGTIFLDVQLRVRKFTPEVGDVFPVLGPDVGRSFADLLARLGVEAWGLEEAAKTVLDGGELVEKELDDVRGVPRLVRLLPYRVGEGTEGVVVSFVDISMIKDAQRAVVETEERFRRMLEHLDQVFWMSEPDGTSFEYVSPLFEEFWGVPVETLYRQPRAWLDPIHPDDRAAVRAKFKSTPDAESAAVNCRLVSADGEERWVQIKRSAMRGPDGELLGFAGSARDITAEQHRETTLSERAAYLEDRALRDSLTGLSNRRGLNRILDRELQRSRRDGGALSAILVDIDDFKAVNDQNGHLAGDMVLQGMAKLLADALRPTDEIARVGGDEFLAVLPATRLVEAVQVAERLRLAIAGSPIAINGSNISATASFGVGMISSRSASLEEILTATREGLRASKGQGKNRVVAATDAEGVQAAGRPQDGGLGPLLDHTEFETWIQEIRSIADGRVVGHELLSRGPDGPYRRPGDFFRLSQENNSLALVDLRCLASCARAAARIEDELPVHVNLFPSTLASTEVTRIIDVLSEHIDPTRFVIDLSEQHFLGAPSYVADPIRDLKARGVKIALDDVGFGRSSLEALVLLEPDTVKIARQCLAGIDTDRAKRAGLNRLLRAVSVLSPQVIAEGVETLLEAAILIEEGIELAQGYLWDRPRLL